MKSFLYAFGAMVWLWCLWLNDAEFNCIAKPFFCFPVRNLQFLAFRFIIAYYSLMGCDGFKSSRAYYLLFKNI